MKKEIETLLPVGSDALVLPLPGFTPGPWHIEYPLPGDTSYCAKAGCQMVIQAPIGPDVCWIRSFGEWSETAKANATLIAATPKLLAVVQKLAAWDKRWPKWSDTNGTSEKELNAICEEAHAIIAEASGQSAPNAATAPETTPNPELGGSPGQLADVTGSAAAYYGSISITEKDEKTATIFVSDGNSSILKDIPKENLKYIIYMADQASKAESQRASCYDEWSSHTSVGIALGHVSKL